MLAHARPFTGASLKHVIASATIDGFGYGHLRRVWL
jgi:hypothetical protein